jgi:hypothetical protein
VRVTPAECVASSDILHSQTILVLLADHTMWQSSNEGYTWYQIATGELFLDLYFHWYSSDRAYLITGTTKLYYTTDAGRTWLTLNAPAVPNNFGANVIRFHPQSDNLLWIGSVDCADRGDRCRGVAFSSRDHGRNWHGVEEYVYSCAWAQESKFEIDSTKILCLSYKNKMGNQRLFQNNPLELVSGTNFFQKRTKLFDNVIDFVTFPEYLLVMEVSFHEPSNFIIVYTDLTVSARATSSEFPRVVGWTDFRGWSVPTRHASWITRKY